MELQEITEFIPQRHAKNENKSRIFMNFREFFNQSNLFDKHKIGHKIQNCFL